MGLRSWLKHIERDARGDLESFELTGGTTYYYDRLEAAKQLFLYCYDLELGDADKWPEPPEILRRICQAQDPSLVLARFEPKDFMNLPEIIDVDVLMRERCLLLRGD